MRPPATGKIKIAYVIGTLDRGGAEHQLVALAKGLDRSRFLPVVFCLTATGPLLAELTEAGVRVHCFGLRGLTVWRNPVRVSMRLAEFLLSLKRERPDIVHGLLFHAYVLGSFAARLAGVPTVIASRQNLGRFKAGKWHYVIAEHLTNRLTDLIIAVCEAVKADVLRQERVPASKIQVIYNGIDPSLYGRKERNAHLWEDLAIPAQAKIIGVVANFIHYKGHRVFLQACDEVRRKVPEARFLLIGDGPLREEVERLTRELHLEEAVTFLGTRQDVPELLTLMDAVVLPSLEEGFPVAILEAMAAGQPVVATAVGGNPEAVVHGETGLLVPPGDSRALAEAMVWLLEHPGEAARFGEAGRRRVAERFEISATVRQYEAVYERLVAQKCPGRVRAELPAGRAVP